MHEMDNRTKISGRISRKPGPGKRYNKRIVQLSTTESEETVLKEPHRRNERFEYCDKYYANNFSHFISYNFNSHRINTPNLRPQSSISNFSNYSLDACIKNTDLESLVQKLSASSHPLCRVKAIGLLTELHVSSFVNSPVWNDLSEQIKICLAENDLLIYGSCFKLLHNIISNSETIREGFIVLLEGSLQISHNESNHNFEKIYSENNVPYYKFLGRSKSDQSLEPSFYFLRRGLNLNNSQHKRIFQMSQLLLQSQKKMSKYWLHWKESQIQDILDNYIDFLSIQVEYSKLQKDKINLLHIISILDPNAKWLKYWLLNLRIAKKIINLVRKNYIFFSFIVHNIIEFLQKPVMFSSHEVFANNVISETQIKICFFLHCLNALSHLLKFRNIHYLFPISTNISKNLTIVELLTSLVKYLNNNISSSTNSKSWNNTIENTIAEVISRIMFNHTDIMLDVTYIMIKPLQKIKYPLSEEVNLICIKILKNVIEYHIALSNLQTDVDREYCIKNKCDNYTSVPIPKMVLPSFIDRVNFYKEHLPMIVLCQLNEFLKQCISEQKLNNAEVIENLLSIWFSLIDIPNYTSFLIDSFVLESIVNCYKNLHKQSSLTNNMILSNLLLLMDKILIRLCYKAISQSKLKNHSEVISILLKRLINRPKVLNGSIRIVIDYLHIFI